MHPTNNSFFLRVSKVNYEHYVRWSSRVYQRSISSHLPTRLRLGVNSNSLKVTEVDIDLWRTTRLIVSTVWHCYKKKRVISISINAIPQST